jgi:hypothetical protein
MTAILATTVKRENRPSSAANSLEMKLCTLPEEKDRVKDLELGVLMLNGWVASPAFLYL